MASVLALSRLHGIRISRGMTAQVLADTVGIDIDRLKKLEGCKVEPWFDEAVILARVLNTDGIIPLITGNVLGDSHYGIDNPEDRSLWWSGRRIPLRVVLRIARDFGVPDPAEFYVSAYASQLWDVMQANERVEEAGGQCPWCKAAITDGEAHKPTCAPTNLWSPRDKPARVEKLIPMHPQGKEKAMRAFGLRHIRLSRRLSQDEMADIFGVVTNHYSKFERGDSPLPPARARVAAAKLGVDVETLYAWPLAEPEDASVKRVGKINKIPPPPPRPLMRTLKDGYGNIIAEEPLTDGPASWANTDPIMVEVKLPEPLAPPNISVTKPAWLEGIDPDPNTDSINIEPEPETPREIIRDIPTDDELRAMGFPEEALTDTTQ